MENKPMDSDRPHILEYGAKPDFVGPSFDAVVVLDGRQCLLMKPWPPRPGDLSQCYACGDVFEATYNPEATKVGRCPDCFRERHGRGRPAAEKTKGSSAWSDFIAQETAKVLQAAIGPQNYQWNTAGAQMANAQMANAQMANAQMAKQQNIQQWNLERALMTSKQLAAADASVRPDPNPVPAVLKTAEDCWGSDTYRMAYYGFTDVRQLRAE